MAGKSVLAQMRARWLTAVVAGVACLFTALAVVTMWTGVRLWRVPGWVVERGDPVTAINAYRSAVGPIFAGLLQALGGTAVLLGLMLHWKQLRFQQLEHVRNRLSEATRQLESAHESTRLSAVHALEDIVFEHPPYAPRISQVVELHVRNRLALAPASNRADGRRISEDLVFALGLVDRLSSAEGRRPRPGLDLRGVDLRGLTIGRWINNAKLDSADLSGVTIRNWFKAESAVGASFRGVQFVGVTIQGNAGPMGGGAVPMDYDKADFTGARFKAGSSLLNASLREAIFDDVVFETHCALSDCDLRGALMRRVQFHAVAYFSQCRLAGADLTGTTIDPTAHLGWQMRAEFQLAKAPPQSYGTPRVEETPQPIRG